MKPRQKDQQPLGFGIHQSHLQACIPPCLGYVVGVSESLYRFFTELLSQLCRLHVWACVNTDCSHIQNFILGRVLLPFEAAEVGTKKTSLHSMILGDSSWLCPNKAPWSGSTLDYNNAKHLFQATGKYMYMGQTPQCLSDSNYVSSSLLSEPKTQI